MLINHRTINLDEVWLQWITIRQHGILLMIIQCYVFIERDYHSTSGLCFGKYWGLVVLLTVVELPCETLQPGLPERVCPSQEKEELVYQRLDAAVISSMHWWVPVGGKVWRNWQPLHSSPPESWATHSLQWLFLSFQCGALLRASLSVLTMNSYINVE